MNYHAIMITNLLPLISVVLPCYPIWECPIECMNSCTPVPSLPIDIKILYGMTKTTNTSKVLIKGCAISYMSIIIDALFFIPPVGCLALPTRIITIGFMVYNIVANRINLLIPSSVT